jgi:hypothetical protein
MDRRKLSIFNVSDESGVSGGDAFPPLVGLGHVWHTSWDGARWQNGWDDRGQPAAGTGYTNLSAVSWGPDHLDVFLHPE